MIGQEYIRGIIGTYLKQKTLPHFLILVGPKGHGKKTLAAAIASKLGAGIYSPEDLKIDSIRAIIADAMTLPSPRLYLLADDKEMTTQAQNALLKLAEEPPANAYIVLTVEQKEDVIETIRSRAVVLRLSGYTQEELMEKTSDSILLEICDNPGQIEEYSQIDYASLYKHCQKVVDSIGIISAMNTFNILKYVPPEQYDLFLKILTILLHKKFLDSSTQPEKVRAYKLSREVMRAHNLMNNKSVNKTNELEMMLLEMREIAWAN